MKQHSQSIVDDHRNMLQVSKNISKFQEDNLKSWAFIFFENVDKVSVSWDFFKKNKSRDFYAGTVTYDIKFKKNTKIDDEKAIKAINTIEACTKFLFWNDTKIVIKNNGKVWKINLPSQEQTLAPKS